MVYLQNVSALVGKTAFLTCVVRNLKPTQRVRKYDMEGRVLIVNYILILKSTQLYKRALQKKSQKILSESNIIRETSFKIY